MKYIFILSALFVFFPLISAELVIADKGMSEYQIVIPDQHRDKLFDKYIALGGNVIRTAVRKASGAELPVRRESVKIPGRSAIYVGNCRELKKYNIDPGRFQPWEHGISVRGRDIFVYGGDAPTPFKNRKPSYLHNTLGSLKAACFFAERFVNTRFVGMSLYSDGENHGVRTLPLKKITIPEKFEFRAKARFRHCDGNTGGLLYAVANNFFFDCGAEYDVHYHPRAVPQEKYFKSNPEYFALINGSRYYHGATALNKARPQYCLSNPAVQELIFREALSRADAGYKVVELGQSDGFKPCQCDNCRKWYGTSKWNEKLWLFHRDLADRLQKARPGVEIAIACYGPTHNIPASFDRFPGKGVIIDVAPATAELLESWKKFNLTGMAAWIYYFGNYLPCGYTPAYDLEFLQRENLRLHNTPVTSFYNCGLMASPALGGPWIYAWGQFCADPRKSIEVILRDYCRFGFGEKAAPYLIRFFKFIDRQMKRFPLESEDFNDFSSRRRINAIKLWNMRYPRSVIAELKKLFSAAMKYCDPADPMVRELKIEFEYMVLSAAVCHLAEELEKNPCDEKRLQLADAVDARRDFINKLPRLSWAPAHISGAFRNTKVVRLQAGGYDSGVFGGVFNSDTRLLRLRNRSLEAVRVKDFSDPRWKSIRSIKLLPMGRDTLELPVSFQLGYNEKAILIRCSAPLKKPPVKMPLERDSMKLWRNAVWETVIAAGDARRHFVFNPLPGSSYDAVVDTRDRRNTRWNPVWSHTDSVKNGMWYSEVTIPFSSCGHRPESGEEWGLQMGYSTAGAAEHYVWNIPLKGNFVDSDGLGALTFGKAPAGRVKVYQWNGREWYGTNCEKFSADENVLKITVPKGVKYSAVNSKFNIPVQPDEKVLLTVKVRGTGYFSAGISWLNTSGKWLFNDHPGKKFELSEKGVIRNYEFTAGKGWGRGGRFFRLSLFFYPPGREATVESVIVKIAKKK